MIALSGWPNSPTRRRRSRRRLAGGARRQRGALAAAPSPWRCGAIVAVGSIAATRGDRTAPAQPGTKASAANATLVRNATPQPDWKPYTGPVPILEYHVLGAAPADAPYPELYVTRPDFHRQMDWLDEHGYEAVTLEAVEDAWYRGGTLPAKPVVISFDDGYRPQFTYALPELRKHGWPGVLNLKAEGSDLYTSNVEAMIDAGWELAAHTIHHLDLTDARSRTTEGRSGRLARRCCAANTASPSRTSATRPASSTRP